MIITFEREWNEAFSGDLQRPGVVFRGVTRARAVGGRIVICPKCGNSMREEWTPHAPRYGSGGRMVDCMGEEIGIP